MLIVEIDITTNNMAELEAVSQGLWLAWDLGFKFIQLEIDSVIVLSWLTDVNSTYSPDIMSLICDCRRFMGYEWEVRAIYIVKQMDARMY